MNLGFAKILDRVAGSILGGALSTADVLRDAWRPARPVERVDRVLVSKFWGLGNWALLRPVVKELRERWAPARLTIATLESNAALVEDLADELLLVRPRDLATVGADLLGGVLALRRRPPQLAVDFEQFSRTGALLARLGGAAQRVGFASGNPGRDGLYTVLVPFRDDVHVSRSFRTLAEAAGLEAGPYEAGALAVTSEGRGAVRRLRLPSPYVVLHPGSGDNFTGRRWSETGFAAVGRKALARGHGVVVTGGATEAALASRIARACGRGAVSVAGRLPVPAFVALIANARVLVSNDTGPVHLASALHVPVLGIYGPNTPVLYGPLAPGSVAFYRGLPCSPCLKTSNYRSSRCRIHTCMASVPTGEVAGALERLLDAGVDGPKRTRRYTWTDASS